MSKTQVPAIDGWFELSNDGSQITLTGTQCSESGTYFFPPERVMSRAPGYADSELVDVPLSTTGTLWSYTDAQYAPPEPFVPQSDPYQPFCLAAVHLEKEQMVVLGQVTPEVTIDDLEVGMEMQLVPGVLYSDDDHDYIVWKWQPRDTSADSAVSEEGANP